MEKKKNREKKQDQKKSPDKSEQKIVNAVANN